MNNIVDFHKEIAAKMRRELIQKTGDFKDNQVLLNPDEEYRERLRALGYA
jgi:CHAD domain-containing protein